MSPVSLAKTAKKLKRELVKSPKKAAILGIVTLVALWFWAPLILPVGSSETETTAAQPAETAPASGSNPSPANETTAKSHKWYKLVEWMEQDSRTTTASLSPNRPSPFAQPKAERKIVEDREVAPAKEEVQDVSPEQLGMVLNSTIVGPRSKMATINNVVYDLAVNPIVMVGTGESDDADAPRTARPSVGPERITFEITEIRPNYVTLVRNGKSYVLKLNQGKLVNNDRIVIDRRPKRDNTYNPQP
jgi:hypothetical protein